MPEHRQAGGRAPVVGFDIVRVELDGFCRVGVGVAMGFELDVRLDGACQSGPEYISPGLLRRPKLFYVPKFGVRRERRIRTSARLE